MGDKEFRRHNVKIKVKKNPNKFLNKWCNDFSEVAQHYSLFAPLLLLLYFPFTYFVPMFVTDLRVFGLVSLLAILVLYLVVGIVSNKLDMFLFKRYSGKQTDFQVTILPFNSINFFDLENQNLACIFLSNVLSYAKSEYKDTFKIIINLYIPYLGNKIVVYDKNKGEHIFGTEIVLPVYDEDGFDLYGEFDEQMRKYNFSEIEKAD